MRRHEEALDLLVTVVGERDDRPVGAAFARPHLDAARDVVGAGRDGDLDAIVLGSLSFDHVSQIDRRRVEAHIHGVDGARAGCAQDGKKQYGYRKGSAENTQTVTSRARRSREPRHDEYRGAVARARISAASTR